MNVNRFRLNEQKAAKFSWFPIFGGLFLAETVPVPMSPAPGPEDVPPVGGPCGGGPLVGGPEFFGKNRRKKRGLFTVPGTEPADTRSGPRKVEMTPAGLLIGIEARFM